MIWLILALFIIAPFAERSVDRPPLDTPDIPFQATEIQAEKLLYFNWGTACSQLKDYRCAIEKLEQSVRLDPVFVPAKFNLALAYYHVGEYENAANQFRDILAREPNNAAVQHYLKEVEQ